MARSTQANVEVRIFGNISDFSKKMNMAEFQAMGFQKKMLAMSGVMKSWGQSMTMGITVPVVVGMALAVKAASSLEETMNKVKVVFGSASGEVIKFSDTAAKSLAMSKQEALDAASAFGNLFNTTGLSEGTSADMSKTLVKLAADMASFNDSTPALMLEKLRSGLVGEAEPLRTVGVLLSEARVQEEAYSSGIADRGAVLTEAQKVQARYNLILEDTKKQQGDLDRTSGSLANQVKFLRAQAIDLGASLGSVLIPALKPVVAALINVAEAIAGLPGWMKSAIVYVGLFAAALGPLLWTLGAAAQGVKAISDAWKFAKQFMRIGQWQAETTAIDLNTAALGRNNAARGAGSMAPGAVGTGVGGVGAGGAAGGAGLAALAGPIAAGVGLTVAAVYIMHAESVRIQNLRKTRGMEIAAPGVAAGDVPATRADAIRASNINKALTDKTANLASLYDRGIMASHGAEAAAINGADATDKNTDALKENTEVQKALWQLSAQEMADKLSAPWTDEQLNAMTMAAAAAGYPAGSGQFQAGQNKVKVHKFARGGSGITTGPMLALIGEGGPESYNIRPVARGADTIGGSVHVHIGTLVGTDERAARQLSDMVGRHIMRGVARGMVGQNA